MSTRRFLLAAAFAAMAFTFFACSSDEPNDGGGNGINLSDLPEELKQVYFVERDWYGEILDKKIYEGSVDIAVLLWHDDGEYGYGNDRYDLLPAGKIQNGQVSLNLPSSINSKYLRKFEPRNNERCQSTLSVVSKNVTYYKEDVLHAAISGRSDCDLMARMIQSGKATGLAMFFYSSESAKVTGTETCTYSDGVYQDIFDMNFSRGWNLYYGYCDDGHCHSSGGGDVAPSDGDGDNPPNLPLTYTSYFTTNLPKDATLEWWLQCDDD